MVSEVPGRPSGCAPGQSDSPGPWVLANLREGAQHTDMAAKTAVRLILAEVATSLHGDGEVTLPAIVTHLRNVPTVDDEKETLRYESLLREGHQELATHLVFQMTGWLTCLWEPLPDTSSPELRWAKNPSPRR